jgi:hypothetical protein
MFLVVGFLSSMYCVTAATFDSLTLKTPYPACQANSVAHFSCTHLDELVLITGAISAADCAGRIRAST